MKGLDRRSADRNTLTTPVGPCGGSVNASTIGERREGTQRDKLRIRTAFEIINLSDVLSC